MNPAENSRHDRQSDSLENFVETCQLIKRILEFDFRKALDNWAERQLQTMESTEARKELAELCERGCSRHVLAFFVGLSRFALQAEKFWSIPHELLLDQAKTLEDAIFIIEDSSPQSASISELRFHASLRRFPVRMAEETGLTSLREFVKYLWGSYVLVITGKPYDKSVSGILAELVGPPGYPVDHHRVWRFRNHKKFDPCFAGLALFFRDVGNVLRPSGT